MYLLSLWSHQDSSLFLSNISYNKFLVCRIPSFHFPCPIPCCALVSKMPSSHNFTDVYIQSSLTIIVCIWSTYLCPCIVISAPSISIHIPECHFAACLFFQADILHSIAHSHKIYLNSSNPFKLLLHLEHIHHESTGNYLPKGTLH